MFIIMTQTLVGMGKATFTVVTGDPFVHFITLSPGPFRYEDVCGDFRDQLDR